MSSSDLGFAIVGTGVAGRYHATAIAQTAGARLVAVCRADASRADECVSQFGVPCERNFDALLARADVEVVCIATPSGLHAPQGLFFSDGRLIVADCLADQVVVGGRVRGMVAANDAELGRAELPPAQRLAPLPARPWNEHRC